MKNHIIIEGTIYQRLSRLETSQQNFEVYKLMTRRTIQHPIHISENDYLLLAIPDAVHQGKSTKLNIGDKIRGEGNIQSIPGLLGIDQPMLIFIVIESLSYLSVSKEKKESLHFDKKLYDLLKIERLKIAKELNLPSFMIASNYSLQNLSNMMPTNLIDLKRVYGFGDKKIQSYGIRFIEIINAYLKLTENDHNKVNEATPPKSQAAARTESYNPKQGYSSEKPYKDNFAPETDIRGKFKCFCGNIYIDTLDECPICGRTPLESIRQSSDKKELS
jgi:hypothetical protein